jgi:tetratricopeptide (TPR) repeat protein
MMLRGDVNGTAWCFGILGFVLLIEGRVEQAADIARNLGGLAGRRGDPHGETLCEVLLALCANEQGDLVEAERAVQAAADRLVELDDRWSEAMVALARARLATDRGDVAAGRAALDEGLTAARSVRDVGNEARLTVELAVTEAALGDPAVAADHARRALALVRGGVGDRESELRALLVLAGAEPVDGARVLLEEAAAVAAGAPTSTARAAAAELAVLLARAGDLGEARRLAAVAADGAEESLRAWVPARRAEAVVLACSGDEAGARSVLATARAAVPDGSRWAAELVLPAH